jgi:hypothetical protein
VPSGPQAAEIEIAQMRDLVQFAHWCSHDDHAARRDDFDLRRDRRSSWKSSSWRQSGKKLAEGRDGGGIFGDTADSGLQRPRCPASAAAKPRKVKDYSDCAGKPELGATGWWGW